MGSLWLFGFRVLIPGMFCRVALILDLAINVDDTITLLAPVINFSDVENRLEFCFCLSFDSLFNHLLPDIEFLIIVFKLSFDEGLQLFPKGT